MHVHELAKQEVPSEWIKIRIVDITVADLPGGRQQRPRFLLLFDNYSVVFEGKLPILCFSSKFYIYEESLLSFYYEYMSQNWLGFIFVLL